MTLIPSNYSFSGNLVWELDMYTIAKSQIVIWHVLGIVKNRYKWNQSDFVELCVSFIAIWHDHYTANYMWFLWPDSFNFAH